MEKVLRVKREPEIDSARKIDFGDDNNFNNETNFCPCDAYAAAVQAPPYEEDQILD